MKAGPKWTLDIEDMLRELRERVDVSPEVVKQVCADLNVEVVILCGVGAEDVDSLPTMFFPSDFLSWVADLGASLNVDILI